VHALRPEDERVSEGLRFVPEEIGPWSEAKLEIIRDYAKAYSTVLAAQGRFRHYYIDAFAGGGVHVSKRTHEFVAGSPVNALLVEPGFSEYHFIDLDARKAAELRRITEDRDDVFVYEGDCNKVLLAEVFPRVPRQKYRRALCLLDPYGLHLKWKVVETAGRMQSIEIFLNFPVMDMNRNVLWRRPEEAPSDQVERMNAFWGDDSWRQAAYRVQEDLFGDTWTEKRRIRHIVKEFQARLRKAAGFAHVPEPVPMRDEGRLLYYLFFAAHEPVAAKIVEDIFAKYMNRGGW
jgi:three-Cys-motif partner protein